MSRHRTTAKMHRVRDQPEAAIPVGADGGSSAPPEVGKADEPAGEPAPPAKGPTRETLEQRLAAEAGARQDSEQRTTDVLARYFKVTLVMVGLNMLVAGASVATLIKFATRTQTVVVTGSPPPPPAPLPAPPVVEKAPAIEPPVSPAAARALARDRPPVPSPPPKIQLLGGPFRPATKPAPLPSPARSARAPGMPTPKKPVTFAAKAAEADALESSRMTERW